MDRLHSPSLTSPSSKTPLTPAQNPAPDRLIVMREAHARERWIARESGFTNHLTHPPQMSNSNDIIALCDFETTGLDPVKAKPIEVGILFIDAITFEVISSFESLIALSPFDLPWALDPAAMSAYGVHGISEEMLRDAPSAPIVAERLLEHIKQFNGHKLILCSDNAHFETTFMRKLFSAKTWPFHYCTWDTSLLLHVVGVPDPKPVPHRAMGDVKLLYDALLAAISIARR